MMKVTKTLQIISLVFLSAFTGAFLFIAIVVVPFWKSSEPSYVINWFTDNFFRFPMLMVPLNLLAFITTVIALIASWKTGVKNKNLWSIAAVLIFLCSITYPIYFASANALFVEKTIQLADVSKELGSWSSWNWLRTLLAFMALIFAAVSVYQVEEN